MTINDFLTNNKLLISIRQYVQPIRFCAEIVSQCDRLKVYILGNKMAVVPIAEGKTKESATKALTNLIKGNRLRIKGWNENDEYVDIKIKVPMDLGEVG